MNVLRIHFFSFRLNAVLSTGAVKLSKIIKTTTKKENKVEHTSCRMQMDGMLTNGTALQSEKIHPKMDWNKIE